MYALARDWGIQPSEFWAMTLHEWFVEFRFRKNQSDKMAGRLTDDDQDRMTKIISMTDEEFLSG